MKDTSVVQNCRHFGRVNSREPDYRKLPDYRHMDKWALYAVYWHQCFGMFLA
jgi:hypothetical protein